MGIWGTAGADALGGAAVAIVAVVLALFITERYVAARESAQARRERDLAAATDLYKTFGKFFAAWKVWDYYSRATGPNDPLSLTDQQQSEAVRDAAVVEGGYESFILWVVMERELSKDQRAALWYLRFAIKELRYAIRGKRRLKWWRSDIHDDDGYREYSAFKKLAPTVLRIVIEPRRQNTVLSILIEPRRQDTLPARGDRAVAHSEITGDGKVFTGTPRFEKLMTEEREKTRPGKDPPDKWVLLAEQLVKDDFYCTPHMKAPRWKILRRSSAPEGQDVSACSALVDDRELNLTMQSQHK